MSEVDEVEVRTRFDGHWIGGYELHDVDRGQGEPRFRVRRQSDGRVLPDWFTAHEIRPPQTPREASPPGPG